MTAYVHAYGLCTVKIDDDPLGTPELEILGYTRNGAEETYQGYWLDVPGDENGGDNGPPIEIQYLGETALVRIELTKYDEAVLDKVKARVKAATAGTPAAAGTLMFSTVAPKHMRLLLHSVTEPRNFPLAIPRMPIAHGRGTKYSTCVVEFECHKNASGVLYNETTT